MNQNRSISVFSEENVNISCILHEISMCLLWMCWKEIQILWIIQIFKAVVYQLFLYLKKRINLLHQVLFFFLHSNVVRKKIQTLANVTVSCKSLLPKQTKERGAISPAWPSALWEIGRFITERQVVAKADATVTS